METFGDKITQNYSFKYICKNCDFKCSNKNDWQRHLSTAKHTKLTIGDAEVTDFTYFTYFTQPTSKYMCDICEKKYKSRNGLWKHKKKCQTNNNESNQQQLVEYLIKENSELKNIMITSLQEQNKNMVEMAKNAGNNNNNTINTNNNFNLQFYLNDTCKDAMNIMDFVSQLQVGIKDLEETGRLGFAEGISKIIINGLNQINVNDRPIHCSDVKRETLYIKNNNEWNKEGDDKTILTNAIKHVAHKNMKQIFEWTKEHPEYNDPESRENDRYLQIVSEAMSGSTKEETNKNYNKIIKNISKETVIEK